MNKDTVSVWCSIRLLMPAWLLGLLTYPKPSRRPVPFTSFSKYLQSHNIVSELLLPRQNRALIPSYIWFLQFGGQVIITCKPDVLKQAGFSLTEFAQEGGGTTATAAKARMLKMLFYPHIRHFYNLM